MFWLDAADLIAGIVIGMWIRAHYKPVLPVKVTILPAEPPLPYTKWSDCVKPIIVKLNVAGHFGDGFTMNPVGCLALSKLIQDMGETLDIAVNRTLADKPEMKEPFEL